MIDYELLRREIAQHPYPLLFATISGAHLYGFPSPDSDFDLRGVHILPLPEVVGLLPRTDTIAHSNIREGAEIDYVTHDAEKFFRLLLKRNGYVLEQLYSPLVVTSTPEHQELLRITHACVTRHHVHHYLGFFATQWNLFQKEKPPRIKPLLYCYRVLLTGIHLMRTGTIEANLQNLNADRKLPGVAELIARKVSGSEHEQLPEGDRQFHADQIEELRRELVDAGETSQLREEPSCRDELNALLIRLRYAA